MRKAKREMIAYEAAGLEQDYTDSSVRYRILPEKYSNFSEKAGLTEQRERVNVIVPTENREYAEIRFLADKSKKSKFVSNDYQTPPVDPQLQAELQGERERFVSIFGDVSDSGGVRSGAYIGDGNYGAYFPNSEQIYLYGIGGKDGSATMKRVAEKHYKDGVWSTSSKYHSYWHELAHAKLHYVRTNDENRYLDIIAKAKKEAILASLKKLDEAEREIEMAKLLSLYGLNRLNDIEDFISESCAEYMKSKCRPLAKDIAVLVIGGEKA